MRTDSPFDEWSARWEASTPDDPDELRAWQLAKAWELAEGLASGNPFYRGRFSVDGRRSESGFREIPVTVKSDVVDDCVANPPYGARTTVSPDAIRHTVETSGSSGKGREVYALDEIDERAIFRAEAIGFWWAGVRPASRVLLTLPIGVSAAGIWYNGGLRLIGANVFNVGSYSTERKVEILARYGADVLIATPSYIEKMAVEALRQRHDPASLGVKSILVAGEPYNVDWVRRTERRWGGAKLYEQYGCTERVLGWTCPGGVLKGDHLGVLHVPPELAYWEVVDPASNELVGDGEFGELITTPLQAAASPLLRFATRDRVQFVAAGSCDCGRPLPGIRAGRVERYDGMMKIRGVNVWPATFDDAILSENVVNYRGVVSSSGGGETVTVEIEPRSSVTEGLAESVTDSVRIRTGLNVTVVVLSPGAITGSTSVGGEKPKRWRDERNADR